MAKRSDAIRRGRRRRTAVQAAFALLTNARLGGFVSGTIYRGAGKQLCLPGLNCYSCPGALGSCPIGAIQATLGARSYKFAFYAFGFLMVVGALLGRVVCGFLCPFGLVQDLLHRIPVPARLRRVKLPGDRLLRLVKYALLALFVVLLPLCVVDLVGQGQPWFCKYVCPSGTLLGGVPLLAANEGLRAAAGWLFRWKFALLAAVCALSVFCLRPFCKYVCPLGAIYGLFNRVALYRFRLDAARCTGCGACARACPNGAVSWTPGEMPRVDRARCRACGACAAICPAGALSLFDVKHAEAEKLRAVTGADIAEVGANLSFAAARTEVIARAPVIPGFNHTEAEMEGIFRFALSHGVRRVDLLPYHTLGRGKYAKLGREYALDAAMLTKEDLLPWKALGESLGLDVGIGG